MAKYLINVVETYRIDNEPEVEDFINDAKVDDNYELAKYSSEYKCAKQKGEIVDEWYHVTLRKNFTAEKEPERCVQVRYE